MGDICPCPCPRRRKREDYPYDVHQQTFEIEEKSGTLDDSSPKETADNNNVLTDELRTSQQSNDRSPFEEKNSTPESRQLKDRAESNEELISTNFALSAEKEQLMKPEEPPAKPVEEPPKFHANILKPKAIKKKYNPDDYRFKDQTDAFKVKKIDSIKEQQYNLDNCKNSSYFIFDITANVYIDDCQNCTIFIAPCESTIFVRNCKKLTIIAVTGQFRTYECHQCTFSLYCKSQPVIESSSELVFTSFNAPIYEQLTQQSQKKRFEPWNNHWSDIHNFTKKEGEQHHLLKQSIDLSHIDWKRAFDEAELPIAEIDNPFPLIMGQLPYQPQKQVLVLFNPDVDNQTALKILKGTVILKGNCGVLQGEGKAIKKVVLIDALDFMPEKYEQLGTVFTDPEQIEKKKQQWFISFGDSREK